MGLSERRTARSIAMPCIMNDDAGTLVDENFTDWMMRENLLGNGGTLGRSVS